MSLIYSFVIHVEANFRSCFYDRRYGGRELQAEFPSPSIPTSPPQPLPPRCPPPCPTLSHPYMCPHHNNYYIVHDELFLYPSITCFTQIFPSLHQILMIFFVIQIKLYHVKCQLTLSNSYFDNLEFRVLNVNLFCGFSFLLRWIA